MRRQGTLAFLGVLAALTITAGAGAEHDVIRLVSPGTANINAGVAGVRGSALVSLTATPRRGGDGGRRRAAH